MVDGRTNQGLHGVRGRRRPQLARLGARPEQRGKGADQGPDARLGRGKAGRLGAQLLVFDQGAEQQTGSGRVLCERVDERIDRCVEPARNIPFEREGRQHVTLDAFDHALEHRHVEPGLAREMMEQGRLAEPGGLGHLAHSDPSEAALSKARLSDLQDLFA